MHAKIKTTGNYWFSEFWQTIFELSAQFLLEKVWSISADNFASLKYLIYGKQTYIKRMFQRRFEQKGMILMKQPAILLCVTRIEN